MRNRAIASAVAMSTLLLVAAACKPAPPAQVAAAGDADYRVRGEIVRLPEAPGGEIWIRHEAIPDFEDAEGKVVGMESMSMPFPVGAGVDLAGRAPGDRVSFTLAMRWNGRPANAITALELLPEGTALAFDPPAGEPTPMEAGPADGEAEMPQSVDVPK
ncbi:MAG: copper-binding protein [Thermoanaerobaculia bacterium]|nr:MAG: copper-binding protein [Thermoanaerobaculia bacterium]MBZ0103655.1 copper-binding protein [Thermoanaerobaculia bacterium]